MYLQIFESLLTDLLAACRDHYGERLVSLVVFGSVARRSQRPDSDIDLMLVVDDLRDGRIPRVREFDLVEQRLQTQLNRAAADGVHTRLSPVLKSPEELEIGSPLLLDMVEEGRILFDRGNVFSKRLERLKRRLEELGARRIAKGGGYYWQLKPDVKPGDVIEL